MQFTTLKNVSIYRKDGENHTPVGNKTSNKKYELLIKKYEPFLIISQSKNLVIMRVVAKKNEYASPATYVAVVEQIPDNKQLLPYAVMKVKQQLSEWGHVIENNTPTKSFLESFTPQQSMNNKISNAIISKLKRYLTTNRVILGVNNPHVATLLTRFLYTKHSVFITTNYTNNSLPKSRLIISIDEKYNGITKLN